jgi:hypothetical protein
VWWWWWWCGFLTDNNTTPTKVGLSCFGLLVGLWQYSGHFVPQQRPRAAHSLRSNQFNCCKGVSRENQTYYQMEKLTCSVLISSLVTLPVKSPISNNISVRDIVRGKSKFTNTGKEGFKSFNSLFWQQICTSVQFLCNQPKIKGWKDHH